MPLAVLEAMSCGKPVIYGRVGSASEIIRDGINGVLCNIRDSEDLYEKLLFLIKNPELRKKIGDAAHETIKRKFNQEIFFRKNIEFYKECITRKQIGQKYH